MPVSINPIADSSGRLIENTGASKREFSEGMKQGFKNPFHYVDGTTISDGTTDARAALLAADAEGPITLPPGTYAVASNLTLTNNPFIQPGAKFKPANGVVITLNGGYTAEDTQHVFDISAGGSVECGTGSMPYITFQHFGATALVADNQTEAMQACLDAGTQSGKLNVPIKVTPGRFVADALVLPAATHLFGSGRGKSVIQASATATGVWIQDDGNAVGINIEHIQFYGNDNATVTDVVKLGFGIPWGSGARISDITIIDFPAAKGIYLNQNISALDTVWIENTTTGLHVTGNGCTIHNLQVTRATGTSIIFSGSVRVFDLEIEAPLGDIALQVLDNKTSIFGMHISLSEGEHTDTLIDWAPNEGCITQVKVDVGVGSTYTNFLDGILTLTTPQDVWFDLIRFNEFEVESLRVISNDGTTQLETAFDPTTSKALTKATNSSNQLRGNTEQLYEWYGEFDGDEDYITLGTLSPHSDVNSTEYSFAWACRVDTPGRVLAGKTGDSTSYVALFDGTTSLFHKPNGSASGYIEFTGLADTSLEHDYVLVRNGDGTSATFELWQSGVKFVGTAVGTVPDNTCNVNLIGKYAGDLDFHGMIRYFKDWNRALSDAEAVSLPTDLVLDLQLNNGGGDVATDSSDSNNHGTITGMTWRRDADDLGEQGGTYAIVFTNPGEVKKVTANANITLNLSATVPGMFSIIVQMDGTGSRTVSYTQTIVGTAPTINSSADDKTCIPLIFDGATWFHV